MIHPFLKSPSKSAIAMLATTGLATWLASWFIFPTLWAIYIAVGIWPFYSRMQQKLETQSLAIRNLLPLSTAILLLVALGLSLGFSAQMGLEEARAWTEGETIATLQQKLTHSALGQKITEIPLIGARLHATLGALDPEILTEQHNLANLIQQGTFLGKEIFSFLGAAFYCVAALAYLLKNGFASLPETQRLTGAIFGPEFIEHLGHQRNLIRSIFNSIVVLGLVEGIMFYIAYAIAGAGQPIFLGMLTGAASILPLASSLIAAGACIYLAASGMITSALYLALFSTIILFVADPIVRPLLAGKNTEMPYWLSTIAMLAGLQSVGLIGLFLGPQLFLLLLFLIQNMAKHQTKNGE
jgi:predicted PurR-regulated permease PerM